MGTPLLGLRRRGVLASPVGLTSWFTFFESSSSETDAAASEEILRKSTLMLARTYLRAADYRDFEQWQATCPVVTNQSARGQSSFHTKFSFPVKFSKEFAMRESMAGSGGVHFGVRDLPQISATGRFASDGDVNAAEIVSISHVIEKHLALPTAVSGRRPPSEKERDEFHFALGRNTDLAPEDVEGIFYSRTVTVDTAERTGKKLIGFGFSTAAQSGVGRFLIRQP